MLCGIRKSPSSCFFVWISHEIVGKRVKHIFEKYLLHQNKKKKKTYRFLMTYTKCKTRKIEKHICLYVRYPSGHELWSIG